MKEAASGRARKNGRKTSGNVDELPEKIISVAKITRPNITGIYPRERLFRTLDEGIRRPIVWLSGPAGSGKTTLIASYLDSRKLLCLWYQMDEGDADIATFFYYTGLAAKKANPGKKPLPLLTSEYLGGIPTFTRRYFEELYSRVERQASGIMRQASNVEREASNSGRTAHRARRTTSDARRFVIVFDNYQDVSLDSPFHETIIHGLDSIPESINIILLSRNEPPPSYARLRANDRISCIGWNEIRLTTEESKEIVQLKGRKDVKEELIIRLQEKTQGWAAGLVLLMEVLKKRDIDSWMPEKHTPQEIFDYFAGEIFEKTGGEVQEFLLKTAFLPGITAQTAERLTGISASEQILSTLNRNHYFTEAHVQQTGPVYQYHPLFREFLLSRARSVFDPEPLAQIQRNAAALLEGSGQIEDAALLLREARDWDGFIKLLLGHARSLATQGRRKTLEEWLLSIPEELMKDSPWLLHWLGVCRMPFDPRESRAHLERAFNLFKEQRESTGLYLSWAGIVATFIYEKGSVIPLDRWITEFELLQHDYPEIPSPEVYARVASGIFCAMMYRRPQHPDLPLWLERLKEIVLGSADTDLRMLVSSQLILYYTWWTGEIAQAKLLVDILRPAALQPDIAPLALIIWRSIEAIYYWMTADSEACSKAVREGFELAEASGIHLWDDRFYIAAAYNALTSGDLKSAREYLRKITAMLVPDRLQEVIFYHYLSAWEAWCLHDLPLALEHGKAGLKAAAAIGMPYGDGSLKTKFAELLFECGEHRKAKDCLNEARHIAAGMRSKSLESECSLAEAKFLFDRGENESALRALRRHLEIDRENGVFNDAWWRSDVMTRLYAKALEAGIEVDHVKELIRRHNLIPDPSMHPLVEWPYPLKVYTLGRFETVIDGKPLPSSGKVQQRPLSMLKALVALGGREIPEDQMTDILWPDTEGDVARRSFDTTLHRLRRLIGNDKAIQINKGELTLDGSYCWVDALAFERAVEQIDADLKTPLHRLPDPPFQGLIERAIGLYKGHFLPLDERQSWIISCRERLRNKFIRLITVSGDCLERAGQWEKAAEYYQKALEADDLAEEIYRRLMICYKRLGRQAEAAAVYRRCLSVLSSLGIEPSPETKEIYRNLRPEF